MPGTKNSLIAVLSKAWSWLVRQVNYVFSLPDEKMLKPIHIATWVLLSVVALSATHAVIRMTSIYRELPPKGFENEPYTYQGCNAAENDASDIVFNYFDGIDKASTDEEKPDNTKECADKYATFIKDKRDLIAQEGMWKAAVFLVGLTAIQFFVGLLGLILLLRTLNATRDTVDAARETTRATENGQRAHVFGMAYAKFEETKSRSDDLPHVSQSELENGHFTYWATVENAGQTPARNVKYTFIRDYGSKEDAYIKETREIGSLAGGESRKIFSYTDDTTGYVKITEFDQPRNLKIRIAVTYTDVFGIKHGPTISNCLLQFGIEAHGTFRILTKDEVLRAVSDPSKSVAGAIYWKFSELRDVWMRVRQTTTEEREAKRNKTKKPKAKA